MSNNLLMTNETSYPVLKVLCLRYSRPTSAWTRPHIGSLDRYTCVYRKCGRCSSTTPKLPAAVTCKLTLGFTQVAGNLKRVIALCKKGARVKGEGINYQHHDRLNVLQRQYQEVPLWWYFVLFLVGFVVLATAIGFGQHFILIRTLFVGLSSVAVFVISFGWLYAISNYQVSTGSFNELIYEYMVHTPAGEGYHNPCGPSTYGAIAGKAWYWAQYMLQDQKIGHYMHIPPRTVFFSQIFRTILGAPINYGVVRWILNTKGDYLTGPKKDPLNQWTGQSSQSSNTLGVQYAVIGPKKLFARAEMSVLPWSFLVGAAVPPVLYILHRNFPRLRVDLWNVSIFFSGLAVFYGNVSTSYTSAIIGGYVVMYHFYWHRFEVWRRYSYMVTAAFDAGFNSNLLLHFLFFGAGK